MTVYLTIDGGTTNTRIYLVKNREIRASVSLPVGAGNGKEALEKALQSAIPGILSENGIGESHVERILASGMISCESGLCPLDHIPAPAGAKELRRSLCEIKFPQISGIPFVFIPGVKRVGKTPAETDVMRGEETELMGILRQENAENALYVLPGSHSKLIEVDENERITSFCTAMTGELFAAVSAHTILKRSVDPQAGIDRSALYEGYETCRRLGLNRTLFSVRMGRNFFGKSDAECYGYLLGAILCGEIGQITAYGKRSVVLGGQKQLREATAFLLERCSDLSVRVLSDEVVRRSAALGAIGIYEGPSRGK